MVFKRPDGKLGYVIDHDYTKPRAHSMQMEINNLEVKEAK